MSTDTTTDPATRQGCGDCGPTRTHGQTGCTGCGRHERSSACSCDDVECLERPLFSAGMVLSDGDLTALVDWTRTRLGLQRYRDGWGVVRGLDVRCDPDRPGGVVVEPGYAVGPCGEDIVLCEPQHVDLTGCCAVEQPCTAPDAKYARTGGEPADPCGDVVVDVVLTPQDSPAVTELVEACGCGGRHGQGRVVPTRLREGGRAEAVRVPFRSADPAQAAAERFQAEYSGCHDVVRDYVAVGEKSGASSDDMVGWLRMQDLNPPCGWWAATCAALDAAPDQEAMDAAVAIALFDLVTDRRAGLLRRVVRPVRGESVGLARVWLRRTASDRDGTPCAVVTIDAYPPYRRELAPPTRPVPAGAQDLTPFLWQRWEQVCHRWRTWAPDDAPFPEDVPASTTDLLQLFDATVRLWWSCGEPAPTPVVVRTGCLGERVVGFRDRKDDRREGQRTATHGSAVHDHPPETSAVDEELPELATHDGPPLDADVELLPEILSGDVPLEAVDGIGATTATQLRDAGINTVKELSRLTRADLRLILGANPNIPRIQANAVRLAGGPP